MINFSSVAMPVFERFICVSNNYQNVRAASGVKWFAISRDAIGAVEERPMPTAVKTCRSSGDNHDHRNAKTGDAAEPLPE
jgi:hypothetical protein